MGSRGRSIRLRIYFLVAIPLVAMVGLLAYVAGTSINNAINLDRAPNLINATALPAAKFGTFLQTERAAAVVYLFQPDAANLQAYETAITKTDQNEPAFTSAMTSAATVGTETPAEAKAISGIISSLSQLSALRAGVKARALSPLDALELYSQGLADAAQAVPDRDQQRGRQPAGPGDRADRHRAGQGAALGGGRAAGRDAGRAGRPRPRTASRSPTWPRPGRPDTQYADYILSPANLALYNAALTGSGPMQTDLTGIEQAIAAGEPVPGWASACPSGSSWPARCCRTTTTAASRWPSAILVADHQISHTAWVKVAVTSGIALLGLLITILVTTLVGRGIIRRLRGLERSALTLAEDTAAGRDRPAAAQRGR